MGAGESAEASARPVHAVAADAFRSWLDGDRTAIVRLVQAMNPVLWHVVRAYRLDEATAKDVVQETWARFVRGYVAIEDPTAVAAWLTVTARREAWRTMKRLSDAMPVEPVQLEPRLDAAPSAEDAAVRRMTDADLWRCVRMLSTRCQRLLRIVAFDDKPDYRRIAEETGMRIGSIGPTRSRCLERLRDALEAEAVG
ncbi:sigma-70 family RNA polymerase sigma factor [Planctomonas sp. JC2975]|uniref:RNA polymerase sigma factor n=1 Tax=Planctomonas sp. JC2975 TaxID=2729626 RepID=UPI00147287D0|nr:sigma-70 family RNA polymerase sigma factor [Planctomonas sp. JC2975]NNC11322.1 sigma-70 family RNA polymerase sigma factor [Planctomonas sp. JC2975]